MAVTFKSAAVLALALAISMLAGRALAGPALRPMTAGGGQVVYDPANGVYWLADADFAASGEGRDIAQSMGVAGINQNGSMSYATAQLWVAALNRYGYLGHHDWQLPTTPLNDATCGAKGPGGASFGGLCQGNQLGSLYYVALGTAFPADAAPFGGADIGALQHLQLAYYWTQTSGGVNGTGRQVFSVNSPHGDVTEVNDVYYYALPMIPAKNGPIHNRPPSCSGSPVAVYVAGPAANLAIYDCETGISWLANANYAATEKLGFSGDLVGGIRYRRPYPSPHRIIVPAPMIDRGAMTYDIATQWVAKLAAENYAGSDKWQLPDSPADIQTLFAHLKLAVGDGRLQRRGATGPFQNLQPFFYWETCLPAAGDTGPGAAACVEGNAPSGKRGNQMNFDFTFGYGVLGTDLSSLNNFVIVNYPAGGLQHPPPLPPRPPPVLRCPPGMRCPRPQ
jgi:hypothetical protein